MSKSTSSGSGNSGNLPWILGLLAIIMIVAIALFRADRQHPSQNKGSDSEPGSPILEIAPHPMTRVKTPSSAVLSKETMQEQTNSAFLSATNAPPLANQTMQALHERIKALEDELAAMTTQPTNSSTNALSGARTGTWVCTAFTFKTIRKSPLMSRITRTLDWMGLNPRMFIL
jgi:hypothetical protein